MATQDIDISAAVKKRKTTQMSIFTNVKQLPRIYKKH